MKKNVTYVAPPHCPYCATVPEDAGVPAVDVEDACTVEPAGVVGAGALPALQLKTAGPTQRNRVTTCVLRGKLLQTWDRVASDSRIVDVNCYAGVRAWQEFSDPE